MYHKKLAINICFFLVLVFQLGLLKPSVAQENTNSSRETTSVFEEIDEETREEIENVQEEAGNIQDAIEEQENNLTEQIREQLPQEEIKAGRGIYDTINTIIDFFGGLSFDDFFGGISLDNILDDIFGNTDASSDQESSSRNSDEFEFSIEAGEIGLPDPNKVVEAINSKKTSTTEELLGAKTGGNGSVVIKDDLRTLFHINEAKEVAEASALADNAQEKLKKKTEAATEALRKSAELAQDSEAQDVTQNIMRNISTQMWLQQQTSSILAMNAQIDQRDDAIANTLMAESLRELNGERVAKNRELASAYSAAITHGAQFTLPGLTTER